MKKTIVFFTLLFLACTFAAAFGVIHDQITYTISPEYYTKFKFHQFGLLDSPLPDRFRAGIVGILASWWMGIPIGLLVGGIGFIHAGHRRMLVLTLRSFVLVTGFTLFIGLLGLTYGFFRTSAIDLASYQGWFIPPDITDIRRFLCVGYMHNASYVGGALSIPSAWIYHIAMRLNTKGSSES